DAKPAYEFGQLTQGKKLLKTIADAPTPAKAENWTVAGKSAPKVDGRAFVTGKHEYASDVRRPGMPFGKVLRPPAFKAKLGSIQTKAAESLPGVKVVRERDVVGAVAPTEQ